MQRNGYVIFSEHVSQIHGSTRIGTGLNASSVDVTRLCADRFIAEHCGFGLKNARAENTR